MQHPNSVQDFYNSINDHYTEYIQRCVPRYAEMQWAILHYIPNDLKPKRILDLGCGAGNLTDLIIEKYPDAEIHMVDISEEMINKCELKYKDNPKIRAHCMDFRKLKFEMGSFDLVLSSISIHHINDEDKYILFWNINHLLGPDGIFSYSDQFSGGNDEIYLKHIATWKEETLKMGTTEVEWQMWMDHQDRHDYHTTLEKQLGFFKKAGFQQVDCVWRYLLWTVVIGIKKSLLPST